MGKTSILRFNETDIFICGNYIYVFAVMLLESQYIKIGNLALVLRLIKYFGLLVCCISLMLDTKISKRKLLFLLFLFLFLAINIIIFDGKLLLIEYLIIFISYPEKENIINRMLKCYIYSIVAGTIFVVISCKIGILEDTISTRYFGDYMGAFFEGEYIRHQYGFLVSNQVPLNLMMMYFLLIAYKKDKVKLYEHIIILVLAFCCFEFFGSRVSLLLICFGCAAYYFIRKTSRYIPNFMHLSFPICTILSFVSGYLYDSANSFWFVLNQIFYNRLKWSNVALLTYGINIWGHGRYVGVNTGGGENLVDNGYVLTCLQFGIVVFLFVVIVLTSLCKYCEKKDDKYSALALALVAIASLIDNQLLSYKILPFLCYAVQKFSERRRKNVV